MNKTNHLLDYHINDNIAMADNAISAVGDTTNINTTEHGSDWPQILNTCDQCKIEFDSVKEAHMNLCGVCQLLFPNADAVYVPCSLCKTEYNCMKEGDGSRCGICVNFNLTATNTAKNAARAVAKAQAVSTNQIPAPATPLAPRSGGGRGRGRGSQPPRVPEIGEKYCETCERIYRPNEKNTVLDCTWCCNFQAGKGIDLFAKVGRPRTKQAEQAMKSFLAKQAGGDQVAQPSNSSNALPGTLQSNLTAGGKAKISKAAGEKRATEAWEDSMMEEGERAAKYFKAEKHNGW